MMDEQVDAATAYQVGDFDVALRRVLCALREDRDDGRAWETLGLVQYARGRFRSCVSALECASLLVPLQPAARVCLAHGYGKIGKTTLSRDLLVALIDDASLTMALLLQVAVGLDTI